MCTSKCTSKVYFCSEGILLYFGRIVYFFYFESIFLHFKGLMSENRLLHFEIAVLQLENLLLVVQIYFFYSESIILYFEGILVYFKVYFESILL